MIEEEQFYTIYDFMVESLALRGNELLMYALLYSFHCARREIRLTYRYLARRLQISERSAVTIVGELERKELITKEVETKGIRVEISEEKITKNAMKKFHPRGEKISPQEIENRNNNNINIKENARTRDKDYSLLSEEEKKQRDIEFQRNMELVRSVKKEC